MNASAKMKVNQAETIISEWKALQSMGLTSELLERQLLGAAMGKQYDGLRDLYAVLGYKKNPVYTDYEAYYRRNEIAKGVITAPVSACWETFPGIEESDESDTPFEQAASEIITKFRLQQTFSRLDTLCSLGKYAVLLLGFKDGATALSLPATTATDLLYATPYGEGSIKIKSTETNVQSPRFGLPTVYTLTIGVGDKTTPTDVHYTRVLHVAQECLTNPVEGTPQLEVIFNRLFDIEKLVGGDAEAFWRLADPGIKVTVDKGVAVSEDAKEKYEDKVSDFIHRYKRHLMLTGGTAEAFEQQIADPETHFSMLLDMVAAGKRIPKRVLLGSELGELASTMDLVRWFRQIKSRREQFCEPMIIRPFFDRLVEVGIIKRDQQLEYNVKWDDLLAPSAKEKADVGAVLATALAAFINSGGDARVPIEVFFGWLGLPPEEIKRITKEMKLQIDDEIEEPPTGGPSTEKEDEPDNPNKPPD